MDKREKANQGCAHAGDATPQRLKTPGFLRQTEFLEGTGGTVECKGNSVDKYGRLIAICFVGGKDLNALMVNEGWAPASLSLLPRNGPRNGHGNNGRDAVPRGGMSPPAPAFGRGFPWPSDGLRHR